MTSTNLRRGAALVALAAAVAAGCTTDDDKGLGDSGARQVDDADVAVWPSPDLFMNVGAYCIGETGVYVHTREAAPGIVGDDPNCDEGGALYQMDRADEPVVLEELDSFDEGNG